MACKVRGQGVHGEGEGGMQSKGGIHGEREARGHACMAGSVCGRGGACMAGGHALQGGHAWQGACMAGRRVWQERRPLQRTVRILLQCILFTSNFACK